MSISRELWDHLKIEPSFHADLAAKGMTEDEFEVREDGVYYELRSTRESA